MNILIPLYNQEGKSTQNLTLKTNFENLKLNHNLISQLIYCYESNKRIVISHTKRRSEVSGTNKKPYKQKGTGYARFGSLRTPIHRGGGVAFGPKKDKNFKKKINKQQKLIALAQVLNAKNQSKTMFAIEDIAIKKINTQDFIANIPKIDFKNGNIILFYEKYDKSLVLSARNIPYIDIKMAKDANIMDVLSHDNVVFTKSAVLSLQSIFTRDKETNA